MRRPRLFALLLPALLVVTLLAAPGVAAADTAGEVVLAVEEGEPLGPDPQPRTDEENPAGALNRYEDRDTPFTWGAAWILAFAGIVGLVVVGGLYEVLVRRPAQRTAAAKR